MCVCVWVGVGVCVWVGGWQDDIVSVVPFVAGSQGSLQAAAPFTEKVY
jgi:hypothetical protein